MSFTVDPAVLRRSAGEVEDVRDTLDQAKSYVTLNVRSCSGGKLLNQFRDVLNDVASGLEKEYGATGGARTPLTGGASSLRLAAKDYETVDAARRVSLDKKVESIAPVVREYDWFQSLDPQGDERGINTCDYGIALAPPTSSHASYEKWKAIEDKVGDISNAWSPQLDRLLGVVGYKNPVKKFEEQMAGKWSEIGLSIAALENVAEYWGLVQQDLGATCIALDEKWDGNASELAVQFFHDYGNAADSHAGELHTLAQRLDGITIGLRMCSETVMGLVVELIDCLPLTKDPTDLIADTISTVSKVPGKVIRVIALIFDALFAACSLVIAGIAWAVALVDKSKLGFEDVETPGTIPVAG